MDSGAEQRESRRFNQDSPLDQLQTNEYRGTFLQVEPWHHINLPAVYENDIKSISVPEFRYLGSLLASMILTMYNFRVFRFIMGVFA